MAAICVRALPTIRASTVTGTTLASHGSRIRRSTTMADLFDALALRPQLARTLARHREELERGTVARRTIELCALMVAWLNACENCTEVHAAMARELGVDETTLD